MRNLAAFHARQTAEPNILQEIRERIDAAILTNGNEFRDDLTRALRAADEDSDISQFIRDFIDGWKPAGHQTDDCEESEYDP